MRWVYLVLAGLFEVGFTTSLKFSNNFTELWPSVSFFVCTILGFWLLNKAVKTIPLGTAYAIWTGIGATGTALVGMVVFDEPTTAARSGFLIVLIGAIIGLKVVTARESKPTISQLE